MVIGQGYTDRFLTQQEARAIFAQGIAQLDLSGKRVLVIIPDSTRSGPIPLCFQALTELIRPVAAQLDFLIALGTHAPMSEAGICEHLGITPEQHTNEYGDVRVFNHIYTEGLRTLGVIPAAEITALTGPSTMPASDWSKA